MFCPKCGNNIPDGVKFCPKCGATIQNGAGRAGPAAQGPSTAQPQAATTVKEKPPKKKRGKKVLVAAAVILALLFVLPGLFSSPGDDSANRNEPNGTADGEPPPAISEPEETDPASGTDESAPPDARTASRTMMVYMIGSTLEYDEGLVGLGSMDIEEMQAATHSEDVNIIIQTGGAEQWKNPANKGGSVQRFKLEKDGLDELDDLGQVCMTKESTLSEFIKFASHDYPAEEYVLVLWDHGGGVPNGF